MTVTSRIRRRAAGWAIAPALGLAIVLALLPRPALAVFTSPPDPCAGLTGKKLKKCREQNPKRLDDAALIYRAYVLAREEHDYQAALDLLALVEHRDDAELLTYVGYATRKLGRVEEGLGYYRAALALDPDYVEARAYMGEALIEEGRLDGATAELAEIARRAGTTSEAYLALSTELRRAGWTAQRS
ncbi:MAG: tetratricopeptide repeat protein [Hyphomicrobiaceae bacterium]